MRRSSTCRHVSTLALGIAMAVALAVTLTGTNKQSPPQHSFLPTAVVNGPVDWVDQSNNNDEFVFEEQQYMRDEEYKEAWDRCAELRGKLRDLKVVRTSESTFERCGRSPNAQTQLADGTRLCVRYRHPHDYYIAGELLSFYVADFLGVTSVECPVLVQIDDVRLWHIHEHSGRHRWTNGTMASVTEWIDHVQSSVVPKELAQAISHPTNQIRLRDLTGPLWQELHDLADMIIFDYVTAHYDRLCSVQDAADQEGRPVRANEPLPNAGRSTNDGQLRLFDNEAGMFDGYTLLYRPDGTDRRDHERFSEFHHRSLRAVACIVRDQTREKLMDWLSDSDPLDLLVEYAERQQPLLKKLNITKMSAWPLLREFFNERLYSAYRLLQNCHHY